MYIVDFLRTRGIWHEVLLYCPASSAAKRAANAHVPGQRVAKAVLLKAGESFILAVVPSTVGIDLVRLSAILGMPISLIRLATPSELLATFPDCEPGAVPPFGRLYGLQTFVDFRLSKCPEIVFGANTRHEGLRMRYDDFRTLEEPVLASFSQPLHRAGPDANQLGRDRMVG